MRPMARSRTLFLFNSGISSFRNFSKSRIRALTSRCGRFQFSIEKALSDDLLNSDMQGTHFSEVPWPARSIEFYFDDPNLPTFLLQSYKPDEEMLKVLKDFSNKEERRILNEKLGKITDSTKEEETRIVWTTQIREKGYAYWLGLDVQPEIIDGIAQSADYLDSLQGRDVFKGHTFSKPSRDFIATLLTLAYKVLVYISIERYRPQQISRKQMRDGKPGVKNRPNRPTFRVVSLPQLRSQEDREREKKERQATHKFLGRRGHFHYYRDPRFVTRQGTFDYFAPVLGPDGTLPMRKFRIRKIPE